MYFASNFFLLLITKVLSVTDGVYVHTPIYI